MYAGIDYTFEIVNDRIARYQLRRAEASTFGLTQRWDAAAGHCGECMLEIGFSDNPLFSVGITNQDDEWSLDIFPGGKQVSAVNTPNMVRDDSYSKWSAGCRASYGDEILSLLPSGTYYLVRSPLRPVPEPEFLLGNTLFPARTNVRPLRPARASLPAGSEAWSKRELKLSAAEIEKRSSYYESVTLRAGGQSCYSLLVGAQENTPPSTNQPLLGLTVLEFTSRFTGILFFPFASALQETSSEDADLLLIIPGSGELVLNADQLWLSGGQLQKAAQQLQPDKDGVPSVVRLCAGHGSIH